MSNAKGLVARCPRVGRDGSLESMPSARLRTALVTAGLSATLLLFSACGDGPDAEPTAIPATATTASTATTATGADASTTPDGATPADPTRAPGDYGPEPILEGYVLRVTPAWGTTVKQAATRTPNPANPRGLCAEVSYEGLPENNQWFRMAVNGVEVTQQLTIITDRAENPTGGLLCYAPEEGLPVGRIQAAVVVQNPNNPDENTRQVAQWEFDVTE